MIRPGTIITGSRKRVFTTPGSDDFGPTNWYRGTAPDSSKSELRV